MPKISQYSSTTPVSGDQFVLARAGSNYRTDFSNLNKVVQAVHTQTGAVATGATTIPNDDSIPQNTEGNEWMTKAITPISATNKLLIEAILHMSHGSSATSLIAALFQDSAANALAASEIYQDTAGTVRQLTLRHEMPAGTVIATTFKIRGGANGAGTVTLNGASGARLLGGVLLSSLRITEFTP